MTHARRLRETVGLNTGIPVYVGIGPTKPLAKAADRTVKKDLASGSVTDTTMIAKVDAALDVLEASCFTPTERILALERVHGTFARRRRSKAKAPFDRFIAHHLDLRQNSILTRA